MLILHFNGHEVTLANYKIKGNRAVQDGIPTTCTLVEEAYDIETERLNAGRIYPFLESIIQRDDKKEPVSVILYHSSEVDGDLEHYIPWDSDIRNDYIRLNELLSLNAQVIEDCGTASLELTEDVVYSFYERHQKELKTAVAIQNAVNLVKTTFVAATAFAVPFCSTTEIIRIIGQLK